MDTPDDRDPIEPNEGSPPDEHYPEETHAPTPVPTEQMLAEEQEDLAPLTDAFQLSTQRAVESYQEATSEAGCDPRTSPPREIRHTNAIVLSQSGTILTTSMEERGIITRNTPVGENKGRKKRDRYFIGARVEALTKAQEVRSANLTRSAKLPEHFEITTQVDALLQNTIPPAQDAGEKVQQKIDEENYEYFPPYLTPPERHRLYLDRDIRPALSFMEDVLVRARVAIDRGLGAKLTKRDIQLFALKEHVQYADNRGATSVMVLPRMGINILVKTKQGSEVFGAIRGAMGTLSEVLLRYEENPNTHSRTAVTSRIEKLSEQVINEANALDRAQTVVSGEWWIILSPQAAGVLAHEVFGHTAEGDIICENRRSKNAKVQLKSRLGAQVSSHRKFSVIDTGEDTIDFGSGRVLRHSWGSLPVDHYGIKGKRVQIVENGIMTGALLNHLNFNEVTAGLPESVRQRMLNIGITGNSRSEKYDSAKALVRMRGTYILPDPEGPQSLEAMARMIPSTQKGIYMKSCNGGWVQTETGEFQINGNLSFLIESGQVTEKPVKNVIIKGTISKLGEMIRALGAPQTMHHDFTGHCGKSSQWVPVSAGGPLILLEKVQLGGGGYGGYVRPWSELVHDFHVQHEQVMQGVLPHVSINLSDLTGELASDHRTISLLTSYFTMEDTLAIMTGQYAPIPGRAPMIRDFSTHEFDETTGELRPRGSRYGS